MTIKNILKIGTTRIKFLILALFFISCSSTSAIKPIYKIPTLEAIRPERPVITEDLSIENMIIVTGYAKKLEAYSTTLEDYIKYIQKELGE